MSLFEASAVGVPSLHRFRLQCNCSILSVSLYMFVVAVDLLEWRMRNTTRAQQNNMDLLVNPQAAQTHVTTIGDAPVSRYRRPLKI